MRICIFVIFSGLSHFLSITNTFFHIGMFSLYYWKFCICNGEKGPLLTPACHHKNPLTLSFHSWHCGQIRPLCSKQDTKNERTNLFFYSDSLEILRTWNQNSSFKYFWTVRIENQIRLFLFWEKLADHKMFLRLTDL